MSSSVIFAFAASLTSAVPALHSDPFQAALQSPEWSVVRGQSPGATSAAGGTTTGPIFTIPPPGTTTFYPPQTPTYGDPNSTFNGGTTIQPYGTQATPSYPAPITQDPWMGGTVAPVAPSTGYGVFGPQPQRFGASPRFDVEWIPGSDTSSPDVGEVEIFGVDVDWQYRTPAGPGYVWAVSPQFNYRSVQGPIASGDPTRELPGSLYRFGLDLALQSTAVGGCTFEYGFTPAFATDLKSSVDIDSFQFDGRAVAYVPISPQWQWVLGVAYWDRVDDLIIPYAGAVWTPNDLWEFRMLFPKSRASLFLGTPNGVPTWIYAEAEYHVESYQVELASLSPSESKVQLQDWRVVGGLRWEAGWVTSFVEGGYVFDRNVEYASPGTEFDINGQFIGRLGFRF